LAYLPRITAGRAATVREWYRRERIPRLAGRKAVNGYKIYYPTAASHGDSATEKPIRRGACRGLSSAHQLKP
ncbi:MAG: hypothetical protein ACP5I8_11965, partial [Phycisphaerae bacterium]